MFKAGNKVRILADCSGCKKGAIGVIVKYAHSEALCAQTEDKNECSCPGNWELVTEENNVKFKHGDSVTCKIHDKQIDDAKISVETDDLLFICQNTQDGAYTKNRLEYKYSWGIGDGSKEDLNDFYVTDLKLGTKVEPEQENAQKFKCGDFVWVSIDNYCVCATLQYGDTNGDYMDKLVAVSVDGVNYIESNRWELVQELKVQPNINEDIRQFESGALRDTNNGKLEYLGFINPLSDLSFAKYMHSHRKMQDGKTMRTSDNWQSGFPKEVLMQSLTRHMEDLKLLYKGYPIVELRNESGTEKVLSDNITDEEFKEHMIETLNDIRFNSEELKLQLLKE